MGFLSRFFSSARQKAAYILESIVTCARWFPVIWRDRQHDYEFLFAILHRKLELMEEFFSSGNAAIKDADKCAREMRVAGLLLKRLEKNTYFSDLEKARKRQLLAEGFSLEEIERAESKIFGGDPLPEGNKTKEERERLARLDRVLGEIWEQGAEYERIRKREDAEYLGKYLSRKIFGWWD